jgi:antitoxin MazE
MRARIVAIGNSRGVRIPKVLLDQAGLHDEVELKAEPGRIVIQAATGRRAGWEEAAAAAHAAGDDALLAMPESTAFDDEEWEWRRRGRNR